MKEKVDVAELIGKDIVDGVFEMGARLRVGQLANRYNTSPMPVREALRALGGEGFVDFEPNKGAQVRTIDADFISKLMEVRASIEADLARRAALRVRPGMSYSPIVGQISL